MKRCPECDFIYLDSDNVCDLDGNVLVPVDGPLDKSTDEGSVKPTEGWKWLALIAVIGMAVGIVIFVTYHRFTRASLKAEAYNSPAVATNSTLPASSPSVEDIVTPSPESPPTPGPKASPSSRTASSTKLSPNAVSTTTDENASHGVTIRLTDGGTISADEAWSTKEGIWFRRNGLVTLIKRNRVKAIDRNR
jgi:hypothetical protein